MVAFVFVRASRSIPREARATRDAPLCSL